MSAGWSLVPLGRLPHVERRTIGEKFGDFRCRSGTFGRFPFLFQHWAGSAEHAKSARFARLSGVLRYEPVFRRNQCWCSSSSPRRRSRGFFSNALECVCVAVAWSMRPQEDFRTLAMKVALRSMSAYGPMLLKKWLMGLAQLRMGALSGEFLPRFSLRRAVAGA